MKALQEVASGLSMTDMSDIMTRETPEHDITVSCQDMPLLWQRPTWKYFQSASHQSYSATAAHKCIDREIFKSLQSKAIASQNLSYLSNDDIHVSSSQSEEITVLRYQYEAILLLPPPPPLLASIGRLAPACVCLILHLRPGRWSIIETVLYKLFYINSSMRPVAQSNIYNHSNKMHHTKYVALVL